MAALKETYGREPGFDLELNALLMSDLLVENGRATETMRNLAPWVEFGWYQSALAYASWEADKSSRQIQISGAERKQSLFASLDDAWKCISRRRRTTRHFNDDLLSDRHRLEIEKLACSIGSILSGRVQLRMFARRVEGIENSCIYALQPSSGHFAKQDVACKSDDVVDASIGQRPLQSAAAVFWLIAEVDTSNPSSYFSTMLTLGEAAQHFCLLGAKESFGVFLTPAVHDRRTNVVLGEPADGDFIYYVIGVGNPLQEPAQEVPNEDVKDMSLNRYVFIDSRNPGRLITVDGHHGRISAHLR